LSAALYTELFVNHNRVDVVRTNRSVHQYKWDVVADAFVDDRIVKESRRKDDAVNRAARIILNASRSFSGSSSGWS